jgi:hypothetical protein
MENFIMKVSLHFFFIYLNSRFHETEKNGKRELVHNTTGDSYVDDNQQSEPETK